MRSDEPTRSAPLHLEAPVHGTVISIEAEAGQRVRPGDVTVLIESMMDPWGCMLRYISDRIAPVIGPPEPPPALPATG